MVLPPSHVVMQKDPTNNLVQPPVYPGYTKSSQKNKALVSGAKLTFKTGAHQQISNNNSNVAAVTSTMARA